MTNLKNLHPSFVRVLILAFLLVMIGMSVSIFAMVNINKKNIEYAQLEIDSLVKQDLVKYEEKMMEIYGYTTALNSELSQSDLNKVCMNGCQVFEAIMVAHNGIIDLVNNDKHNDYIGEDIVAHMSTTERADYVESLLNGEIFTDINVHDETRILTFHQAIIKDGTISSILVYVVSSTQDSFLSFTSSSEYYDAELIGDSLGLDVSKYDEVIEVDTVLMTVRVGLVRINQTVSVHSIVSLSVMLLFIIFGVGLIRNFYIQTKRSEEYLAQLKSQARHHRVTKLYNSNQLYIDVDQLIEKKVSFYFALGHLNNIKNINDRFGHDLGERLLIKLSKMMKQVLSNEFKIYHFGGDEYVIIGIEKSKSHFSNTLKRILSLFEEDIIIDKYRANLSMTFGISHYPSAGSSAEQLLNNAHISMRDMLNNNQNMYYFYEPSKFLDRLETDDFDQYVKRLNLYSFELELMPVAQTKDNHIMAFECLSRLYDDFGGLMPTEKVIQSLERVGRIQELDEIIFEKMLKAKKVFDDLFGEKIVFSVNASAMSFNEGYVEHVIALMKKANMTKNVVIELTESYKVEDYEYLLKLFKKLNTHGIEIAIDDFGSGYSSIGYISKFPLYAIKVDKRFVRDYKDSLFNQTLLKTLISICDVLGSNLVAEGVDTHETLAFLKENDCPYYQGFLFSKGIKIEEAIKLYKKHS